MRCLVLVILSVGVLFGSDKLLQSAHYYGLKPVPKDLTALQKQLNIKGKELSKQRVVLGKKLFNDKNLSLSRDISCASCHSFKKVYDTFLVKLDETKKYYKMQFKSDASLVNFLKNNLGEEELTLIRDGFFHLYENKMAYKEIVSKGCLSCHDKKTNKVDKEKLAKIVFPFENKGGFLGKDNPQRFFRVPLLRNVVRTYPYFHNGEIKELEDAIKLMVQHQHRTKITDEEVKKIVSFLKAVDGEFVEYVRN